MTQRSYHRFGLFNTEVRLFTRIMEGEMHSSGVLAKTFLYGLRAVFDED